MSQSGRWPALLTTVNVALIVLLFGINFSWAVMTSDSGYQIWADVTSSGGGENVSSDNYDLGDTVSEQGIGRMSSSNYVDRGGFRDNVYTPTAQTLTFSIGDTSLDFGTLSKDSNNSVSHTLTVGTNSPNGVVVTYSGNTLTKGADTISVIGSVAVGASAGSNQFGLNAVYASGSSPVASAVSPYSSASQYAFSSGDTIISSGGAINNTVFNINYIANVAEETPYGVYSTSVTYTATAIF